MAIPKQANKLLNERISLIDDTVDNFRVEDIEVNIVKELKKYLLKELDLTKDGKIKPTRKNLKAIRNIKKLKPILLPEAYREKVATYINTFNQVRTLSDQYIKEI